MALSREITLTIDDYNITLDKEIKIYEYDAINLCFTIQECGIVMRDGKAHNRIMPIVALRAYMLIETPQGTDSVEATNIVRNKIMFSLGNKYSGFVGTGKMQIILKDFDGCRITLPEFAYEVKQSINTGWDDGSFDVLITEKGDTIITDELGRPVETTKISEMDEVNEITPQTYTVVINEDGNKKIKLDTIMESIELDVEEIDRIIDEMIEVYDDEEIEVEFPSLHNDVERIKGEINEISESLDNIEGEINEISESLDNIEGEKATRQEVDVERKRIDNINSSLENKANKSEVDNDINGLDVKIAENKSLTDSEISKINEIANTWESFKNTGGTISGDVDFSTGLNARRVSLKNEQNDFFSFITLNDTTIGIKFNDSILQTLDRFGEFYIGGYSKEPNGYTKLPNGLIMQWATLNLPPTDETSIYLPISFPNKILSMYATPRGNRANGAWSIPWWDNRIIKVWNGSNIEINYYVLAIGY